MSSPAGPRTLPLAEAAAVLRLPADGVEALVGAGYLRPAEVGPDGPRFALGDLKAFHARVSDGPADGDVFAGHAGSVDPQALLDALDGRADEMARRAFDIFQSVFPETAGWSISDQARFIDQARSRFEAILAVTSQGDDVDANLVDELEDVGAAAAWGGASLPQLLVVLRISRDLVVQTAVEVAEERGRHWGLALSLLLTRVLPAIDRLTDAIAKGYWSAVLVREAEGLRRYENVVEHSSDGVYEIDPDGRIQYANQSLAIIVGRPLEELDDLPLAEVLRPADGSGPPRWLMPEHGAERREVTVLRRDNVRRVLDVRTLPRRADGAIVGYQGVVRDVTAQRQLDTQKNEFLALITHDLRQPLTVILGLGATLETYAADLAPERVARMGTSVRRQSERISRLADDLYDVSLLETQALALNPRGIDLAPTVETALLSVLDPAAVEVHIAEDLVVHADARRLEQVVANLVENAVVHGGAPVVVDARAVAEGVELRVRDHGPGVPEALQPTLFSRLRTINRPDRDRGRGTGLGLSLVRGLVEAMGGRVWYEPADGGGACFRLLLPGPRGRPPAP